MKKTKVMGCIMALALSTAMVIPVSAANTSDTALPGKVVGYSLSSGADTGLRNKTDASSNYIYNKSGFNLWVMSKNANGTNYTVNNRAIVPNAQRRVRNYIYERGFRSCKLNLTSATAGVSGLLKGVWSPDCAGNYPAAN